MISRNWRALFLGGAAAFVAGAAGPARAQWVVFDPTNYAQNILTAAHALQQVNNQIRMLANQATSLTNQARNLESLPYSSLAQLGQSVARTEQLLGAAQRVAYSVATIDRAFAQTYPQAYSAATSSQQLLADAQARWRNARAGYQDAMRVQAGVVQNLDVTRSQVTALVTASQGAAGALQAAQSGNQLAAVQIRQLADLTALMAAAARAQNLNAARALESRAQAQAQMRSFLDYGAGYRAGNARMFH